MVSANTGGITRIQTILGDEHTRAFKAANNRAAGYRAVIVGVHTHFIFEGFTQGRCLTLAQGIAAQHRHRLRRFHIGCMPGQADHIHHFYSGAAQYQIDGLIALFQMKGFVHKHGCFYMQLHFAIDLRRQAEFALGIGANLQVGTHYIELGVTNWLALLIAHHALKLGKCRVTDSGNRQT